MVHHAAHQPPPENVVAELVRAGVSITTAMAMERWKAQEVLDLLRAERRTDDPATGKPLRCGGAGESPDGPPPGSGDEDQTVNPMCDLSREQPTGNPGRGSI